MRSGYHGRAPYRDEELEAAEELVPDPFSEEPHTRPHIRRRSQQLAGERARPSPVPERKRRHVKIRPEAKTHKNQ